MEDDRQPCSETPHGTHKPSWLKTRMPRGEALFALRRSLRAKNLFTVCEEANCPNLEECWRERTATLMLLGSVCTRGCPFCNVTAGNPAGIVDPLEPQHTAESIRELGLSYVVLTMVTRDDLADGGAAHLRATMVAIRECSPATRIELLASDFGGSETALACALEGRPVVFAHNLETIAALTPFVRAGRADYGTSLRMLAKAKQLATYPLLTKSALMLGLGESDAGVKAALADLRACDVDFLTIGQYLQPSPRHLPVAAYEPPERFAELGRMARDMGFRAVAAAPLVRSSYKAQAFYEEALAAQFSHSRNSSEG